MPGTFVTADEERAFLDRLKRAPPDGVLWPLAPFDDMPSRSLWRTAPRLSRWVASRYRPIEATPKFLLLLPIPGPAK